MNTGQRARLAALEQRSQTLEPVILLVHWQGDPLPHSGYRYWPDGRHEQLTDGELEAQARQPSQRGDPTRRPDRLIVDV